MKSNGRKENMVPWNHKAGPTLGTTKKCFFIFYRVFLALQFSCIKGVSDTNGLLFQMKQNLAIQF